MPKKTVVRKRVAIKKGGSFLADIPGIGPLFSSIGLGRRRVKVIRKA